MAQTIAIIDYGSGNLRSAAKAFDFAQNAEGMDARVIITAKAEDIFHADKIVLPGQGAFADCMNGLKNVDGMIDALEEKVLRRATPFFGICVGMQLMAERGLEFGEHNGLGWIAGDVVKMDPADTSFKIPHMGWNNITPYGEEHLVLQSITKNSDGTLPDFYFVRSFMFECKDAKNIVAHCDYGGKFTAMVARDNMIGCQFHPEKSQDAGLDLIRGFLKWNP